MKIEKGRLYYNTIKKEVLKADDTVFLNDLSNVFTDKIAVHCPTEEDFDYVTKFQNYNWSEDYSGRWDLMLFKNLNYISLCVNQRDCRESFIKRGYHIITIDEFKKFYPEKTPEKFYTEATPRLVELHKNYKGAKDTLCCYDSISFFDNCNGFDQTGYFCSARNSAKAHYNKHNYTEVTEEEFIKLMELEEKHTEDNLEMVDNTNPKHYNTKGIQPIDYIEANNMNFNEGNVIKYVTRYKEKNGLEDLKKAKVYLQRLIDKYDKK